MASWFIVGDGRERGPFNLSQLQKLVNSAELLPSSTLRRHDGASPISAADIEGLFLAAPGADLRWKDDPQPSEKRSLAEPKSLTGETVRSAAFDPYHVWFGIRKDQQPPTHYRLLGLDPFEHDAKIIEEAVKQRLQILSLKKTGPQASAVEPLVNEIKLARKCLLDHVARAAYDRGLCDEPKESLPAPAPVTDPLPELTVSNALSPLLPKKKPANPIWQFAQIVLGGATGVFLAILVAWYGLGKDITGYFTAKRPVAQRPIIKAPEEAVPSPPAPPLPMKAADSRTEPESIAKSRVTAPPPEPQSPRESVTESPATPPTKLPDLPPVKPVTAPKVCRIAFKGHAYALLPYPTSWDVARQACEKAGGHLVTIETAEENDFLLNLSHNCLREYWIGASDAQREGEWKWVDGAKVDFNILGPVADNAFKKEHWLAYWPGFRNWNDQMEGTLPFMCEWDSTEAGDCPFEVASEAELKAQSLTIGPTDSPAWKYIVTDEAWTGSIAVAADQHLQLPGSHENFELRCQVRLETGNGSGRIGFRNDGLGARRELSVGGTFSGYLFDWQQKRFLHKPTYPLWFVRDSAWNDVRLRVQGPVVQAWINDIKVVDYKSDAPITDGAISFFAGTSNAPVSYRRIRLRSLNPVSRPVASSSARQLDRSLWMYESGFFSCDDYGKWTESLLDGRQFYFREIDRNEGYIELRDDARGSSVRLALDAATIRRDGQRDFATFSAGGWQPGFKSIPAKFPALAKSVETYETAEDKARTELLQKLRARVKARPSDKDQLTLQSPEAELNSFERAGLIPWSQPLRADSVDYLKTVRNARETLLKSFVTEVTRQKGHDSYEPTLRAYRFHVLRPMIVAELDCRSVAANPWDFHYTLFIDGYVNDRRSSLKWRFDQDVIELTGIPGGLIDRYSIADDGVNVEMVNSTGGKATGTLLKSPDATTPFTLNGDWIGVYPDGRRFPRSIQGIQIRDWEGTFCRAVGNGTELSVIWPTGGWERFVINPATPDRLVGKSREGVACVWERQQNTGASRNISPEPLPAVTTNATATDADDRRLWMHEAGFFACREPRKWTEMLTDGRMFVYREVDRTPLYIDLRDDSNRNTVRLSSGSATSRRDGQGDFIPGYLGTWQPSLDVIPSKLPALAKGEGAYKDALKRARDELIEKLNIRITRLRKSNLKSDRQSLENLEVDLKSFERAGLVPWSAALRPASLDYLKDVRNAREAMVKLIAAEVSRQASANGPLEKTLQAYRPFVLEPMIVMELDCRSTPPPGEFQYTLFIDGYVNDPRSPIRWRADQSVIELTGIPKDLTDRYIVDPSGRAVEMTNNHGGKATGKLTTAPDAMMPFQLNGEWIATYPDTYPDGRKFIREIKGIRVRDWDGKQDLRLIGSEKELRVQWPGGPWERFVIDPASPDRMVGINREGRKCVWERRTEIGR